MDALFVLAGVVALIVVIVDILWTTLWVDGGSGPVSARLTTGVWRGLRAATGDRSRALSLAGPLSLALTLATWIALLWAGWTLVFSGDGEALVSTHTGEPADWTGRIYYVAYTMFTNGNGDYTPTAGSWELASSLTTATGMAFVTLGVSYVLTVLGAVSEKRAFASGVTGLGARSEAFVRTGWSGDAFEGVEDPLETLASQLTLLADKHEAYPILHYYHSEQSARASAVAVPVLDEAATLYEHGVADDRGPDRAVLASVRAGVDSYLETLEAAFIEPADEVPPPPDLDRLRADAIPTVDDDAFAAVLRERRERRRKLLGVVRADAWRWPPVEG